MKKLTNLSWIFISALGLSFACAQASTGGDGDGDGTTLPMTGGSSSGGASIVTGNGGGLIGSGGLNLGGVIIGTGGTPAVSCMDGEMIACSAIAGNTTHPVGMATCNATGDGWDQSTCLVCEADTGTIDCTAIVGGAQDYTGGTATCNATGDGWVEDTCTYCGDDTIDAAAGEECDGAAVFADTTCEDLLLDPGAQGTTPLACNEATCKLDISDCGLCDAATYPGAKCIEDAGCTSSADCTDAQCAAMNECDFSCSYAQACTGMSCNRDATCEFTCPGETSCSYECLTGSTCSGSAGYNDAVTAMCESGATCDIACPGLASVGKACTVDCEAGSTCSVSGGFNSEPEGTANCASGTCVYDFETGRAVPLAITCENDATCTISTTYQGSISNIVCSDTSTCNITCGGAATCSYTCAETATCMCSGDGTCTEL